MHHIMRRRRILSRFRIPCTGLRLLLFLLLLLQVDPLNTCLLIMEEWSANSSRRPCRRLPNYAEPILTSSPLRPPCRRIHTSQVRCRNAARFVKEVQSILRQSTVYKYMNKRISCLWTSVDYAVTVLFVVCAGGSSRLNG